MTATAPIQESCAQCRLPIDPTSIVRWRAIEGLDGTTDELYFCGVACWDAWSAKRLSSRPTAERRIPVLDTGPIITVIPAPPVGDPRFHKILDEIRALHEKKGQDYGDSETGDFLANVRVADQWGVPPWVGVAIRMTDKVTRLQSFAKTGVLANEGAEDSLLDLASYSIIALILLREETDG